MAGTNMERNLCIAAVLLVVLVALWYGWRGYCNGNWSSSLGKAICSQSGRKKKHQCASVIRGQVVEQPCPRPLYDDDDADDVNAGQPVHMDLILTPRQQMAIAARENRHQRMRRLSIRDVTPYGYPLPHHEPVHHYTPVWPGY